MSPPREELDGRPAIKSSAGRVPPSDRRGSPGAPQTRRFERLGEPVHPALPSGQRADRPVRLVVGRAIHRHGLQRPATCGDAADRRRCRDALGTLRTADSRASTRHSRPTPPPRSRARDPAYCSSNAAAVFAPMPAAPGMPSDLSPRSAMRSGTWLGATPTHSATPAGSTVATPLVAALRERTFTFAVTHWKRSRSPVTSRQGERSAC